MLVPDRGSGCSLADSLDGGELRRLKGLYPDAAVVCYINSTAEVKAESDVCVTSSNVYDIVERLPERRVLFVPDRLMADNIRNELKRRGVDQGDHFLRRHLHRPRRLRRRRRSPQARARFPGLKVVAHPECPPAVARGGRFCRQHRRDDAIREANRRALLPHADRMRPGRPAAGRGAG